MQKPQLLALTAHLALSPIAWPQCPASADGGVIGPFPGATQYASGAPSGQALASQPEHGTAAQGAAPGVAGDSPISLSGASGAVILPYVKPRGWCAAGAPSLVVEGGADTKPAEFDAGTINLNSTALISHTFILRNASDAPVTVTRIQVSCECLSVTVPGQTLLSKTNPAAQQTADFAPIPLAPRQKLPITVSIDPSRVAPGQLDKWVFLYTNGGQTASAVLTLHGEATTGVTVGPASESLQPEAAPPVRSR